MTSSDMDQVPKMVTITAGDQLVIDIPEDSIRELGRLGEQETLDALSRFIVALSGEGQFLEEDVAAVISIEGVIMTLPGSPRPITMQEVLGSILIMGSPNDITDLKRDMGE